MKKILLSLVSSVLLISGNASASEFSLFGVAMGMKRAEVDTHWQPLQDGKYMIEGSLLLKIEPQFDHQDRLYRLNFSIPIPLLEQHPVPYVTTSFQDLIQERWAGEDTIINIRTGRGIGDVMLTSKSLQAEYTEHIRSQMLLQLGILLKP